MKDKMLEEYVVGLFDKLGCDTEVESSVGNHLEARKRVIEKFERRIDCQQYWNVKNELWCLKMDYLPVPGQGKIFHYVIYRNST